ncbi:hypothetical protein [Corynebacterium heidelbergense]|uniref:Uncharacterized protein n=1 Tax=Corynebacterium heidelbergense TaxID=2055947 RepID=A0A364VAM4_9CORY|nr:hypothetical protein [Corynebacterium heidelbergense]RAV33616.1 hypothetical protein CWC39_07520 [Corynebacterium heidelbergense]WCZ35764.1 hypothetical protein CHEID_00925 [Corynebacterium heidelbergense]
MNNVQPPVPNSGPWNSPQSGPNQLGGPNQYGSQPFGQQQYGQQQYGQPTQKSSGGGFFANAADAMARNPLLPTIAMAVLGALTLLTGFLKWVQATVKFDGGFLVAEMHVSSDCSMNGFGSVKCLTSGSMDTGGFGELLGGGAGSPTSISETSTDSYTFFMAMQIAVLVLFIAAIVAAFTQLRKLAPQFLLAAGLVEVVFAVYAMVGSMDKLTRGADKGLSIGSTHPTVNTSPGIGAILAILLGLLTIATALLLAAVFQSPGFGPGLRKALNIPAGAPVPGGTTGPRGHQNAAAQPGPFGGQQGFGSQQGFTPGGNQPPFGQPDQPPFGPQNQQGFGGK